MATNTERKPRQDTSIYGPSFNVVSLHASACACEVSFTAHSGPWVLRRKHRRNPQCTTNLMYLVQVQMLQGNQNLIEELLF